MNVMLFEITNAKLSTTLNNFEIMRCINQPNAVLDKQLSKKRKSDDNTIN